MFLKDLYTIEVLYEVQVIVLIWHEEIMASG